MESSPLPSQLSYGPPERTGGSTPSGARRNVEVVISPN